MASAGRDAREHAKGAVEALPGPARAKSPDGYLAVFIPRRRFERPEPHTHTHTPRKDVARAEGGGWRGALLPRGPTRTGRVVEPLRNGSRADIRGRGGDPAQNTLFPSPFPAAATVGPPGARRDTGECRSTRSGSAGGERRALPHTPAGPISGDRVTRGRPGSTGTISPVTPGSWNAASDTAAKSDPLSRSPALRREGAI